MVSALARREAPAWLDRGFRLLTHLGSATFTTLGSLALMLPEGTRRVGLATALANLGSHLLVQLLKRSVVRPRPSMALPELDALAAIPDHFSFPSGHSAAAMSLAVPILMASPAAGSCALALALGVGASRVYLRVHYVTDVIVGQALGALFAIGAVRSVI